MSIKHPKILYLYSAPLVDPDGEPLDALGMKAEKDAIIHELSTCKKEILLRIGVATVDELAKSIEEGFNILHVSCHGREEFLLFEDGKGGSQPVTGDYLKRFIQMGGPFELAVVSACYSEKIGALLVEAGIPHVVAITCDVPVLDHAAIAFVGQFFRSLFQGDAIQKAFEMAKLLVEGNPDLVKIKRHLELAAYERREQFVPEEKKFVLLPKESTHADPLLSEVPQGIATIEESVPSPSNLPVKPQTFTGRSVEMHTIICELLANRFVTITGAGGIGKTTLAIEVARFSCSRTHFPDGVYYIDLRETDTADGIVDLLGATFGVQFSELKNAITYLQERHCLLLLDNAEDILWQDENAMQDIIDSIFKFTPHTRLLITSQRPVEGNLYEPELVYRLYSLEQHDAASLFCATTKRRILQKEWESETFHDLLEQLGGHPLSIVLIARQLAPGIFLEDLRERIKVHKAKAIQVKNITDKNFSHGESLVASLVSAHHILSDEAKSLFEILSMLPAGAQQDMLKEIYGNTAWEYVQELNDASLAEIREYKRVTLLPPVRFFAMSVLTEEVKEYYGPKIVEYLGGYAEKLYERHSTKDAKEYRFYFTVDEPNFRCAVDLPCNPPQTDKEPSALGLLGPSLVQLYLFHNRLNEAEEIGKRILSYMRRLQDQLGEANTLKALGNMSFATGPLEETQKRYEKALKIYRNIDVKEWEADTLLELGFLSERTGRPLEEAQKRYEKVLKICQNTDVELGEANIDVKELEACALLRLGSLALKTGNVEEAQKRFEKVLKICWNTDAKEWKADALPALGYLSAWTGDFEEAQKRYEEALTICQCIDSKLQEGTVLWALGDLAMWTGDFEEAQKRYEKALTLWQCVDLEPGEARTFIRLAQWAALTNRLDQAETYLGNAFTMYKKIDDIEGQASVHMVKALVFLKHHNVVKAKYHLDYCSSIRDKICAHSEAAGWLIIYAAHFKLHDFREGAKLCLEYAEKFALAARNQHLQNMIKQLAEMNVTDMSSLAEITVPLMKTSRGSQEHTLKSR